MRNIESKIRKDKNKMQKKRGGAENFLIIISGQEMFF